MGSSSSSEPPRAAAVESEGDKGLKSGALGFMSTVVIGIGIGSLLVGILLMLIRERMHPEFFERKSKTEVPGSLESHPARIGGEVRDLDEALQPRGREATHKAEEQAKAAGVRTETLIIKANLSTALSELANERGARCIIVSGYGERPVTGVILGSAPHKLLHITTVPVVVVPVETWPGLNPAGGRCPRQ